eukprot:s1161_g10.t1
MGEVCPHLSCVCQVCLTWRRLGVELSRGHSDSGYLTEALAKLRWAYNELIDYREANNIGLELPVAAGGSQTVPPAPSRGEGEAVEKSPAEGEQGSPEESEKEEPQREAKEREALERERDKAVKDKKKKTKEEKNSRGEKKEKKAKTREEDTRQRSEASQSRRKKSRKTEEEKPFLVKEEPAEEEEKEDQRQESQDRGEVSPVRLTEAPQDEEDEETDGEGREADCTEPPPGRWYSEAPPPEPVHPPRFLRPHQPSTPPPGWSGHRGRETGRSKGVNRILRRPAAVGAGEERRPRRRPAAAEEAEDLDREGPSERDRIEALDKYHRGELVQGALLAPGTYKPQDWVVVPAGVYYKKEVSLAGKVEREEIEGEDRELRVVLTGTESEELLRHATAQAPCRMRLHLCGDSCPQLRENLDLVHVRQLRKVKPEEFKGWETNLQEVGDTGLLRADQEAWRRREEGQREPGEKKKSSSDSSSAKKKKRKKKKKKKKEKEEKTHRGEKDSPAKGRLGGRKVAKKSLESVFRGTGLDPDPKRRKKVVRKLKKSLRKTKDSSSSTSSTSSGSTSSEACEEILVDRSKVHQIATRAPGVLTNQAIQHMKQFLTRVTGPTWEEDTQHIPPLLSLYCQHHLSPRLNGGVQREAVTLAYSADLLVQGRVAEATDCLIQRLKSIELTSTGSPWSTSQRLEIVPGGEASMGSRPEYQMARREAKLDQEIKGSAPSADKGRSKGKDKGPGKTKDRGKGKTKETDAKKGDEEERDERKEVLLEKAGQLELERRGQTEISPKRSRDNRMRVTEEVNLQKMKGAEDEEERLRLEKRKFEKASERQGVEALPSDSSHTPAVAATTDGQGFSCQADLNGEAYNSETSLGLGQAESSKKGFHGEVSGVNLGEIASWLESRVDALFYQHCKTVTMGRLFPLPTSPCTIAKLFPSFDDVSCCLLRCLVLSLNSMNGEGTEGPKEVTEYQKKVLCGLMEDCSRVAGWRLQGEVPTWQDFFRVKGVDYKGEEVLTAQVMRWENVAPALPKEVGGVELEKVVDLGCRHYVLNFEDYLLDPSDQVYTKPPKVMVPPDGWSEFCSNLLKLGVFSKVHEDDLYRIHGRPLLNGLFGVSKQEFVNHVEVQRIIMNLIPLNKVTRGFDGDISTLPSWAGMTPLVLQPHEDLVVSSEDVRAFFYIFKVPTPWHRFLAFNRELPKELCGSRAGRWYPCSSVLPMGFKNSVSLAQHVHRYIVRQALVQIPSRGGEGELRKERPFSRSNPLHRIYLDNFDELERVSKNVADLVRGTVSPLIQKLQDVYATLDIPRHPKKAVARQPVAEVQGAIVDGNLGLAYPKVEKVLKYAHLTRLLLQAGWSSQKQMQIVGGGLVYMAMFRRPLLGGLNHIWQFIISCEGYPPVVKFEIPFDVKQELSRFLGLIPLAYMDFRCQVSPVVTASDASETGGGVTASTGLTAMGVVASDCAVRGDIVEPTDIEGVLTIGLFDGIGALRVAADALGWNVLGHISIEKSKEAARVVESRFPGSQFVHDVQEVDAEMVRTWAQQFTQVSLVVVGAGPPCQGVSGLNAARKGALRDERSCLFTHVDRIRKLVRQSFPWAQVQGLMENVASMDSSDETVVSESFGTTPWYIDASGVSLAHRPRLYWVDWEIALTPDVVVTTTPIGRQSVQLKADVDPARFITPGWSKITEGGFPTFTTSRPRQSPGYKPAGIRQCEEHELARWRKDQFRFPPYQYQDKHCLQNRKGEVRLPNISEREVIMGFPKDYTQNCVSKGDQGSQAHLDTRLSLIGNSWNVTVVAWLLSQLGFPRGINRPFSVQEVVDRTSPGCSKDLQTFLQRPPLRSSRSTSDRDKEFALIHKMLTLVSIKGEDISLQASSEDMAKYHRLRASIPSRLWRWKTMASWHWTGAKEHINALELRAALTALRWRLERHKKVPLHVLEEAKALLCFGKAADAASKAAANEAREALTLLGGLLSSDLEQGFRDYVLNLQGTVYLVLVDIHLRSSLEEAQQAAEAALESFRSSTRREAREAAALNALAKVLIAKQEPVAARAAAKEALALLQDFLRKGDW